MTYLIEDRACIEEFERRIGSNKSQGLTQGSEVANSGNEKIQAHQPPIDLPDEERPFTLLKWRRGSFVAVADIILRANEDDV